MIDQLKPMAIFVSVVEMKSFRGAAKTLGLSPSVISGQISKLETHLGSALLYRSTRSIALTEEGKKLFEKAKEVTSQARNALELFSEEADNKLTRLRIAIPATMHTHPIISKITGFSVANPGIMLEILSSDQQIDLTQQGVDVAIRMGQFRDSDLRTRKIGVERRVLVAAPSYFEDRAIPSSPEDLEDLDFLSFSLVPDSIDLKKLGQSYKSIWGKTAAISDSAEAIRALAKAGMGVAALPFHAVATDIENEDLLVLLPAWTEKSLPISLTWPRNATLSSMTRKFIDDLAS